MIVTVAAVRQVSGQVVYGAVVDDQSSAAIPHAVVTLQDSLGVVVALTVAGEDGEFRFEVSPGFYRFLVRRIGYLPITTPPFEVDPNVGDVEVTILAPREAVTLDVLSVAGERLSVSERVRLRDFYEHQELGFGAFITPEDIRQRHASRLTDLLREIAGVRVLCSGSGFATSNCAITMTRQPLSIGSYMNWRSRSRGEGAECPVSYYIDGAKYTVDERGIDALPVTTVLAIEVYRGASETPVQFLDSDSRCGVIAIWTGDVWEPDR